MLVRFVPAAAFAVALSGVGTMVAGTPARQPRSVTTLAWLAGCWEQVGPRFTIEEQWMRPSGGTLLGLGRTVRRAATGDTTTDFEFARVFARNDKLVYAVIPSGQAYTEFTETELSDSSVVFGNPQHDFPQFIRYWRRGRDSLLARIDGSIQGRARAVDFKYARTRCGGPTE